MCFVGSGGTNTRARVRVGRWNHNTVTKRWSWRDVEMSARRLVTEGPKTYDNGTICQQRKLAI